MTTTGKHVREGGSKTKKRLLAIAAAAACCALMAGGTLAYFTAEERAHNVITSGGVDIALLEWADEGKAIPFEKVDGVMPGQTVVKVVEVENTGVGEAWVRVKVTASVQHHEDRGGVTADLTTDAMGAGGVVDIDFDASSWTYQDGWWYYNVPLASGKITSPLFTSVTLNGAMGNDYQLSTLMVDVSAQAVQVKNNLIPAGGHVTDVDGWPAEQGV